MWLNNQYSTVQAQEREIESNDPGLNVDHRINHSTKRIAILNLMPLKEETENIFNRILVYNPFPLELVFIRTVSYSPKNSDPIYLKTNYRTFDEVRNESFDGMVFTGAPVEHLDFLEVAYWEELILIMDWAKYHIKSSLYICWAAQAALFHRYQIEKYKLDNKLFGVFKHQVISPLNPLFKGFNKEFEVPHSRYTFIRKQDIINQPGLNLLSFSKKAGVHLVADEQGRSIYATGHAEYNADTLKNEYVRDLKKGLDTRIPENYFPNDNVENQPKDSWKEHGQLFFKNWIEHFIY